MIGVSFDHLVSDLEAPLVCAFRVAYKHETNLAFRPDDFALLGQVYHHHNNSPNYTFNCLLKDYAVQVVNQIKAEGQPGQQNDLCADRISTRSYALFQQIQSTCRPRCFALEWLMEQEHNKPILIGLDSALIKSIIIEWSQQLKSHGFGKEADYLCSLKIITWNELNSLNEPLVSQIYIPSKSDELISTKLLEHHPNTKFCQVLRLVPDTYKSDTSTETITKVTPIGEKCRGLVTLAVWKQFIPLEPFDKLICGNVVHGFKRGSRQLGIPTANIDTPITFGNDSNIINNHSFLIPGVYAGWCAVKLEGHDKHIYGCILNAGYCPYYGNENPTLEVHIFGELIEEFYGARMAVDVTSLIRAEGKFTDFSELIDAIQADCESCAELWQPWQESTHFNKPNGNNNSLVAKRREPCTALIQLVQSDWKEKI